MPLTDFPVRVTLPVLWGNQDLFGHVNNAVYMRWFESARVAYWEQGMRRIMQPNDWGPILASVTCHYRLQLNFPDTVHIGARITQLGRTSLTMEHAVFSEQLQKIAADGTSIVVVFNYKSQRPTRISPELQAVIEATEGRSVPCRHP